MPENIPETGDVVIHSSGHDATPTYGICAVPARRDALAVNFFKNQCSKLGLIEYSGGLTINSSLLSIVLHD
jgi:hypothetical protein